jgi:tetratricopeptide (TPR) repeat protein
MRRGLLLVPLSAAIAYGGYVAGSNAWAVYHYRLAQRDLEHDHLEQARRHLAVCLHVWPSNTETCLLAAQTARRAHAYDDAECLLRQYQQLGGVPEALELERALLRAERGDLSGLETRLWDAADRDPAHAPLILEALVEGFLKNYRWPQAKKCLRRWLELQPDNPQALFVSGLFEESIQDIPRAKDYYQRVVDLDPENHEAQLHLGLVLFQMSQPNEAAPHFEELLRRHPEDTDALLGLARCRRDQGQPKEAKTLLDRLLALNSRHVLGLTERGKLALSQGQPAEGENWLKKAVELAPYEREPNYSLCLCLRQQPGKEREVETYSARLKQIEADQGCFRQLLQQMMQTPRDVALRQEIGTLLLRNGQTEDGLGWLRGILQEDPKNAAARQALANYYEHAGNRELAARYR